MKIIAFLSYDMEIGGAEKMITTLLPQFIHAGYAVDLVLVNPRGQFLAEVDPRVNLVSLNCAHTSWAVFAFAGYLRRVQPDAVFSSLTHLNLMAVAARSLAHMRSRTRLILIEHNTISRNNLAQGGKEKWLTALSRRLYPRADRVIVVSKGSAKDLLATIQLPPEKVRVIYNPIDLQKIRTLALEAPDDPWLTDKRKPVLLAIGRLMPAKNFAFLLDVFAEVRQTADCSLIILGEGPLREPLTQQINALNLSDDVRLPGTRPNPYAFLSRADMLLCTSDYEGFNLTIAEALACGTPVVSVDCPHGPAEILANGSYGTLVPLYDASAMSAAILHALQNPPSPAEKQRLMERAADFSAEHIFMEYETLLNSD